MPQTIYHERTDIALMCRALFGAHILHNEGILLYSELPDREDSIPTSVAAKKSLEEGYLDFIAILRKENPGRISDRATFINSLEAVYCLDSIEDMNLVKYVRGEDNITKLVGDMLNREKVHVLTEGEVVPEIIVGGERDIPVYVLVRQSFASLG